MSVWWGGRVRPDDDVPLADDRGLLLGDGLFETILVRDGAAAFLDRHLARLAASAAHLRIALPPSLAATVAESLPEMFERERRPARAVLRVTLTRGRGRGLTPPGGPSGLVLTLGALPGAQDGVPAAPVTACVVAAPRVDPRAPLAGHKVLSSMARVHARLAAQDAGADVALLPTVDGDICEADAANVFAVVDGVLVTPPLDRGVLPGITRARCLAALARDGGHAAERRIASLDLARASEAFLTSSLDGVRPLRAIDGREIAAPGPLARRLARCITSPDPS